MAYTYTWDFFIAHSKHNRNEAEILYNLLYKDFRVFLDTKCLKPGDDWDIALCNALNTSFVTLILISTGTESAYYQREEIARAIANSRNKPDEHRTIPIYLDEVSTTNMPYGLQIKQGLFLNKKKGLEHIAETLKKEYMSSKFYLYNENGVHSKNKSKKTTDANFNHYSNQNKMLRHVKNQLCIKDSVIWIDIDKFTTFNAKYGKLIADSVIYELVRIIESAVQIFPCLLFRVKNRDDFIVITEASDVENVADKLSEKIKSFKWDKISHGMYIHCSLGIGKRCHNERKNDVLRKARLALNEAKHEGGNTIRVNEGRLRAGLRVNYWDS